jgi:hypothetical protein
MSTINAAGDVRIGIQERIERSAWIVSPSFDFFLLIFAPLVTLPIIAGVYYRIPILAIGAAIALAFSHYASTLSFYFWNENREYQRTRWMAFFLGPALITVIYLVAVGFAVPYIIQVILLAWNTFHVARQNNGILAIYRARAGVSHPDQKPAAHNAIVAVSAFLTLWNINTHEEFMGFFGWFSDHDLSGPVKIVAFVIAAYFVGCLLLALLRRPEPIGIPEGLFLLSSLAFFWPYLFIKSSLIATLVMLLPHYVQYLALVWLLHRRKFGAAREATGEPAPVPIALRLMSGNLIYLVPVLFVVGWSVHLIREHLMSTGRQSHFEVFYLLIAFLHYYVDGLVWSFRRPHVRQTILPFLLRRPTAGALR